MLIYPKKYIENVKEIKIDFLEKNNIKALILDVDNTLIDFNKNLLDGAKEWCDNLKKHGIKFYILSNSNKIEKIEKVSKEMNIPYISFAKKPFKKGFLKAKKMLEIEKAEQIAVVRRSNIYRCNRCK